MIKFLKFLFFITNLATIVLILYTINFRDLNINFNNYYGGKFELDLTNLTLKYNFTNSSQNVELCSLIPENLSIIF